jgi:hypothetical protein
VPPEVRAWADQRAVIGSGSVWVLRQALDWKPVKMPDGTYATKFPWYILPPGGVPTISGRRLDGVGVFRSDANVSHAGGTTFVASSLMFSNAGCWRVMGRDHASTVTFRIQVPGTG